MLIYLDANVLICAARGTEALAARAFTYIDDPSTEFAASVFLELELLPNSREQQFDFYKAYFDKVAVWAKAFDKITEVARREALAHGMSAIDALHLGAAATVGHGWSRSRSVPSHCSAAQPPR